jgi:hypothetical protein
MISHCLAGELLNCRHRNPSTMGSAAASSEEHVMARRHTLVQALQTMVWSAGGRGGGGGCSEQMHITPLV